MWHKIDVYKKSGIYAIVNKENGMKYIGRAIDIHRRWKTHKHKLEKGIHENKSLQTDVNYFGLSAFKFEVLEFLNENDPKSCNLNQMELQHIFKHKKKELYNQVIGKDMLCYYLCEELSAEYIVDVDYKNSLCVSEKNRPLNWNLRVESPLNGKVAFIYLISEKSQNDKVAINSNVLIRENYIKRSPNYRYIKTEYLNYSNAEQCCVNAKKLKRQIEEKLL